LTQDRRNLVLDSICPNLAPHIVITPPVDIRDDYYSPFQNSIAPQWLGYLVVPPSPLYLRSSAHWPPSNESRDSKPGERSSSAVGTIPDTIRTTLRPSRTVFSPSKFAKMVYQFHSLIRHSLSRDFPDRTIVSGASYSVPCDHRST
jgi:hypothetical protein